jgi:hypothetical protein
VIDFMELLAVKWPNRNAKHPKVQHIVAAGERVLDHLGIVADLEGRRLPILEFTIRRPKISMLFSLRFHIWIKVELHNDEDRGLRLNRVMIRTVVKDGYLMNE